MWKETLTSFLIQLILKVSCSFTVYMYLNLIKGLTIATNDRYAPGGYNLMVLILWTRNSLFVISV